MNLSATLIAHRLHLAPYECETRSQRVVRWRCWRDGDERLTRPCATGRTPEIAVQAWLRGRHAGVPA